MNRPQLTPRSRRGKKRRGAVIVEFAVVAPVLVLLCMATIDLCALYYLRQTCKLAAYEGCRIGLTTKGSDGLVNNQAQRILNSRRVFGYTITTSPSAESLTVGQLFKVTISAPSNKNLPLRGWLIGGGSVTADVTMVSER
jgi:hypothetical protein